MAPQAGRGLTASWVCQYKKGRRERERGQSRCRLFAMRCLRVNVKFPPFFAAMVTHARYASKDYRHTRRVSRKGRQAADISP